MNTDWEWVAQDETTLFGKRQKDPLKRYTRPIAEHTTDYSDVNELFYELVQEHVQRRADIPGEDWEEQPARIDTEEAYRYARDDDTGVFIFAKRDNPEDDVVSRDHVFIATDDGTLRSRPIATHVYHGDNPDTYQSFQDWTPREKQRHETVRNSIFTALLGRVHQFAALYEDVQVSQERYGSLHAQARIDHLREQGPPLDGEWTLELHSTRSDEDFHLSEEEIQWQYEEENREALQSIWQTGMNAIETLLRSNADT